MRFVGNLVLFIGAACFMFLASDNTYDFIAATGDGATWLSVTFMREFRPAYGAALTVMMVGLVLRFRGPRS